MSRAKRIALYSSGFALAAAVHFTIETVASQRTDDLLMSAVGAVLVLAGLTVITRVPDREVLAGLSRREWAMAAVAGIALLLLAPFLVLSNRYVDAPSGTESAFFTATCGGALVFLGAAIARRDWSPGGWLGVLTAVAGNAAILADWERPSSFSPFVRFETEAVILILSAGSWLVFAFVLERLAERLGRSVALWVIAAPAAAVGAVIALLRPISTVDLLVGSVALLPALAISTVAMLVAWSRLTEVLEPSRAAAAFFLGVPVITLVSGAEYALLRSAQPMLLPQVALATIVTAVGVLAIVEGRPRERRLPADRPAIVLACVGTVGVLLALAAMAMPSVRASVSGTLDEGGDFAVTWFLVGAETAGAWLALIASAWLIHGSLTGRMKPLVAGLAVTAAYPVLYGVPLRTWTRWIPVRVQQDYGTEYAVLTFEPVRAWLQIAAVALAALGLVVAAALLLARRHGSRADRSEEHA